MKESGGMLNIRQEESHGKVEGVGYVSTNPKSHELRAAPGGCCLTRLACWFPGYHLPWSRAQWRRYVAADSWKPILGYTVTTVVLGTWLGQNYQSRFSWQHYFWNTRYQFWKIRAEFKGQLCGRGCREQLIIWGRRKSHFMCVGPLEHFLLQEAGYAYF